MLDQAKKHYLTDPVIVLGVHRSGTSLLTRMIEKLGVFVGGDLQQDYESNSIIAINNHYFTCTNSSWDRPEYLNDVSLEYNPIAQVFASNYEQISARFGPMNGLWGMKDPRFVVTLPLWRDVFPNLRTIVIRRDVKDIAKSLYRRHSRLVRNGVFPPTDDFVKGQIKFTQRCSTQNGAIEFAQEQMDTLRELKSEGLLNECLELEYEKLVDNPAGELSKIVGWLNIRAPKSALAAAQAIPRRRSL